LDHVKARDARLLDAVLRVLDVALNVQMSG
jgi:hypothetical protein